MDYTIGTIVFNGDWEITRRIGSGASGIVYEIKSTQLESFNTSALKVIRIPQSDEDKQQIISEGMDETSLTDYYASIKQEIVREVSIMMDLDGHPNIVSLKQYLAIPHEDGIGWDILIRMELLTTVEKYFADREATEDQIINVGQDIAAALNYMAENGIIHRDIKPENIFINKFGRFKLGDFGAARVIEKSVGMSKKGTELYMAPEVYRGEKYDECVDVYSLGIVLYKLANNNRLPFYPPAPEPITWSDRENALLDRMNGKAMPAPAKAGTYLAKVILKACAYRRDCRFKNALELYNALSDAKKARVIPKPKLKLEPKPKPGPKPKPRPKSEPKPAPKIEPAPQPRPDPYSGDLFLEEVDTALRRFNKKYDKYSMQIEEQETILSRTRAKKQYRKLETVLLEIADLYEQIIVDSDKAMGAIKKAGVSDSDERLRKIQSTKRETQTKLEKVLRDIDTLPKPKPIWKLVVLMVFIVVVITIVLLLMTNQDDGVKINILEGSVVEQNENAVG